MMSADLGGALKHFYQSKDTARFAAEILERPSVKAGP